MNKTVIVAALLMCCAMTANAAPPPPKGEGPLCPHMMSTLNLSEEQAAQVKSIMREQHAKMQALHEETRTRMSGVLNEEQLQQFDQMHMNRYKGKHHHGMGDGMGHHRDCPLKDKSKAQKPE